MRSRISRRLAAATRAGRFCHEHPFTNPAHLAVAAELDARIARADQVAVDELTGRRLAAAATRSGLATRQEIHDQLRLVARIAALASHRNPELVVHLQPPRMNAALATFITRAQAIHHVLSAHGAILAPFGLALESIDQLAEAIDRLEANVTRSGGARAQHVGARAELVALSARIGELIKVLDAVNRIRFRNEPGLLAAWTSTRTVVDRAPVATDPPADDSGSATSTP